MEFFRVLQDSPELLPLGLLRVCFISFVRRSFDVRYIGPAMLHGRGHKQHSPISGARTESGGHDCEARAGDPLRKRCSLGLRQRQDAWKSGRDYSYVLGGDVCEILDVVREELPHVWQKIQVR